MLVGISSTYTLSLLLETSGGGFPPGQQRPDGDTDRALQIRPNVLL